jgi:succinoglycan biosynthesis protein ExoM
LLQELQNQSSEGRFTFSIVVADNDSLRSAESVVDEFRKTSTIPVAYCVEPKQNIARTRNRAIDNAQGDFIAFIDDDELPTPGWLLALFTACQHYQAAGVLGPVRPRYEVEPPRWVTRGKFYERPVYRSGFVINWQNGRTGNVLLKKDLFVPGEQAFRPDFVTGEDQDFFRRMIQKGNVFVWCNEAVAYEIVPPIRWKRSFMLRRALLRGKISITHPTSRALAVLKSIIAVPIYGAALPFLLLLGQSIFMKYLIKLFDHAGRLFAVVGLDLVKDSYITE